MRVALVSVLAALVAATVATAAPAAAIKSFKLPGGKVECVIASGPGAGALCIAFLKPGVKPFPKPKCDAGDPGGGLSIGTTGRARGICLSENPFVPPVKILRYGAFITLGGVSCAAVSPSVGVRCANAVGHGFRMSPSGWRRF